MRILRMTGFGDLAEEAGRVLPDPVDIDELAAWAGKHGISREVLINRMGGSP